MPVVMDSTTYRTMEWSYDADGKVWCQVKYENDGVKNTPGKVRVDATGYYFNDLADDTQYYMVGIPPRAEATNVVGWVQIGGRVLSATTASIATTAGSGLSITGGAVAETAGADFGTRDDEFAVAEDTDSSGTNHTIWLVPREIHAENQ